MSQTGDNVFERKPEFIFGKQRKKSTCLQTYSVSLENKRKEGEKYQK